jgi:thymidylate kinase
MQRDPINQVSPIVAFCGIDGSGKTTMVNCMSKDPRFRTAAFVNNQKEDYHRLLRLAPPIDPLPEAYLNGSFAQAARWALALDFLRFYERIVQPLEYNAALIVSDRWSFCTITLADVFTNLSAEIEFTLRNVPLPTLTFYLEVDPKDAIGRLQRRGPLAHDEHIQLLTACRDAYDRYFNRYRGPLTRITTSTKEETYSKVVAALKKHQLIPRDSPR